jgi:hypothetical protein
MKKPKSSNPQLEIFQTRNEAQVNQGHLHIPQEPKGKQVYLDNRSRIYEKILNRKME